MGDIYNACINYKNLLDKEYYFILGKNKKEIHISLNFSKIEFYHICGLHKLSDIVELRNPNKIRIFDDILTKKISSDLCKLSSHYSEIDDRIALIENLEGFLDSNKTIFKFNKNSNSYSLIDADYILKNSCTTKNMYVFISKDVKKDNYFCRSAFPRDKTEKDYSSGHTSYTLLYKEKIDLITNERQVLYTNTSYKKDFNAYSAKSHHHNDNIKIVKFDNPAPQGIEPIEAGAAAAVFPLTNPLKNFFIQLRQGIKELFRSKDDVVDTLEMSEKNIQSEIETISSKDKSTDAETVPQKPYSDELSELINTREHFIAKEITLSEYGQVLGRYLPTLKSSEMCEQVKEILQSQLSECGGDDMKIRCIGFELHNLNQYSENHFSQKPKQTLAELTEYAHNEQLRLRNKANTEEKQTVKRSNDFER